jgi:hypothetical protein
MNQIKKRLLEEAKKRVLEEVKKRAADYALQQLLLKAGEKFLKNKQDKGEEAAA